MRSFFQSDYAFLWKALFWFVISLAAFLPTVGLLDETSAVIIFPAVTMLFCGWKFIVLLLSAILAIEIAIGRRYEAD